ncbi:MAG: chaperone modulator CbpM [Saprospiraceae bacterium]|nr:chaperone modulator CbpM [Saprospiraceae bacterium]
MNAPHYIPLETVCTHYQIEVTLIERLGEMELLEIHTVDQMACIHEDHLSQLERLLRLQQELHLDSDSLDVVLHLVQKVEDLQSELNRLQSRLQIYESR